MKTPVKRFSKQAMIDHLSRAIDSIQLEHNFDPQLGYYQILDSSTIRRVVDYGRFRALWDLRQELEEGTL